MGHAVGDRRSRGGPVVGIPHGARTVRGHRRHRPRDPRRGVPTHAHARGHGVVGPRASRDSARRVVDARGPVGGAERALPIPHGEAARAVAGARAAVGLGAGPGPLVAGAACLDRDHVASPGNVLARSRSRGRIPAGPTRGPGHTRPERRGGRVRARHRGAGERRGRHGARVGPPAPSVGGRRARVDPDRAPDGREERRAAPGLCKRDGTAAARGAAPDLVDVHARLGVCARRWRGVASVSRTPKVGAGAARRSCSAPPCRRRTLLRHPSRGVRRALASHDAGSDWSWPCSPALTCRGLRGGTC